MILIILFILIILNIFFKKKGKKINLFPLIIILLILFSGMKCNYSFDYDNYLIHFNEMNSFYDVINTSYEKGYALMAYLFRYLGFGFNSFLLFISFLSIQMKSKLISKFSVLPEVSLLLYFSLFYIFNDVEQIRHGISISFCLYSIVYMMNKDKRSNIIALLLIIIGVLFHTSAILFVPFYFIRDKDIPNKKLILLFLMSFFISFVDFFDILSFFNKILIHSEYISLKIQLYDTQSQSIINISLLIKLIMLIGFYYFAYDKKNENHRLFFNLYYYGIILTCVFNLVPILTARSTTFMRYGEIFLIPYMIVNRKDKTNTKVYYIFLLLIFSYYFIKFISVLINPEYFYYTSI